MALEEKSLVDRIVLGVDEVASGRLVLDEAAVAAAHSADERRVLEALLHLQNKTRERAEELHNANAFLEAIVENIPDMVFVKDATELRFVRFNKAGESLLGAAREDLYGKNDYDFFPQDEADSFTGKDREVLEKGKLHDIPVEPIHTARQGTRYLHTKKVPILDETGEPKFLLGISEDITEAKAAKEKLAAIQAELEASPHISPVPFFGV